MGKLTEAKRIFIGFYVKSNKGFSGYAGEQPSTLNRRLMLNDPNATRILLIEDQENSRLGYEALLRKWGYEVAAVGSSEAALDQFAIMRPEVLLADVELPGMDGLTFMRRVHEDHPELPAIVITGRGSDERAVEAIEAGAFWYIEKPLKAPILRALLERASRQTRDQRSLVTLTRELRDAGKLGRLVGESPSMRAVMHQVELAAPSKAFVLITGETGTGKEMVARTLHELSPRASCPFVAVNCSAIPESLMESEIFGHERGAFTGAAERRLGCFELADRGTLLLDEIGEMPVATQAKLLRVLEEGVVRRLGSKSETSVDVRVLAATNKDPQQAVDKGALRQDLFFRLNVFHVHLPPLREHKEDLTVLTEHLLKEINDKHSCRVAGVSPEVMQLFCAQSWPGNVRQLRNILERAAIARGRGEINLHDLPEEFGLTPQKGPGSGAMRFAVGTTVAAAERELIRQTLEATANHKTRAAELLGISLKTLHNKLKEYASAASGIDETQSAD
jgi:DNA-binding NtrC family response regulator